MTRSIALLLSVLVAALAVAPAAALAQDNPFLQDPTAPQSPTPVTPPAPAPVDDDDDGDLSPVAALAIGGVVVALIAGIWIAISRDARRHAPRRERVHSARVNPNAEDRRTPGQAGLHRPRSPRHRKPSRAERERRKRGRAR